MPTSTKGLHHLLHRKRMHSSGLPHAGHAAAKAFFDKLMYALAIITPLTNLPQLLKIWLYNNAAGVSSLSWAMFTLMSAMWFIYGLVHKERPIWIMNGALIFIQSMIAIGAVVYG